MRFYDDTRRKYRTVYIVAENHGWSLTFLHKHNGKLLVEPTVNTFTGITPPEGIVEIESSQLLSHEKYAIFEIIFTDDAVTISTKDMFLEMIKNDHL